MMSEDNWMRDLHFPELPVEAYEDIRQDKSFMLQGTLCLFGSHALFFMNTLKYTHEYKDGMLHINRIENEGDE